MARGDEMIENPATGERVVFRRTSAETNGELLEYEFLFRPRGFVAAEHVHPRQEERHEVLGGRLGISVAGREQVLQPGDAVVVPPGTPHRLWSVDDEPAHVLFQLRPALRAEELISTFVHLARAGKVGRRGYPRLLQLAVLADEFGDEGFVTRPPRRLQQAAVALLAPLGRRCGYRADYRTSGAEHRRLTTGIRRFFYAASLLVLAVGAILFVGSTHTARYFAWTIKSPLTAAFLGANYLAAVALELLAARQREWARVRVAFWPVLAFTSVTLVVTLIHLDRFHLHGGAFVTRLGTWIWLAIYVVVPPVMIVLGARQLRVSGVDAPRSRPFPRFFIRAVVGQAAVLTGLGAALLIAPLTTANVWPWALTPLTGRAIGAWLLGMGLGSLLAVREADFERARIAFVAFGAAVLLQVVALARYGDELHWPSASAVGYLAVLMGVLALSLFGSLRAAPPS